MSKNNCTPCEINTNSIYTNNQARVNRDRIYVKPNGEYSLDQIDVLLDDFKREIVNEVKNNSLDRVIERFPDFDASVVEIRNFVDESDISEYPELQERMATGVALTGLEIAEFYESNIFTPSKVTNSIQTNPGGFLNQLNCFFMGSAISKIMGGFCSTLQNVFGAISGFFDLINGVASLINLALETIAKIKNLEDPLKAVFEAIKVKAIIEAIKEKIIQAIKMALKCVIEAIQNFVGVFEELVESGQRVAPKIAERYVDLKDKVSQTFSEENQESLLRKIENTIDYGVSRFANPSISEVSYLAFRICGMASAVENLINAEKLPLDRFAEKIADVHDKAKVASGPATAAALDAGAIRLSPEARQEEINTTVERCQEAGSRAAGTGSDDDPPVVNAPAITPEEVEGLPSYEEILNGHPLFSFDYGLYPNRMGPDGYYGIKPEARVKLMRLQARFGRPIKIKSGYRSPAYQDLLRREGQKGVAKRSKHMSGTAIDVTWDGFNRTTRAEVARIAREVGFKGLGYYNSFLHVDLGPTRSWNG